MKISEEYQDDTEKMLSSMAKTMAYRGKQILKRRAEAQRCEKENGKPGIWRDVVTAYDQVAEALAETIEKNNDLRSVLQANRQCLLQSEDGPVQTVAIDIPGAKHYVGLQGADGWPCNILTYDGESFSMSPLDWFNEQPSDIPGALCQVLPAAKASARSLRGQFSLPVIVFENDFPAPKEADKEAGHEE